MSDEIAKIVKDFENLLPWDQAGCMAELMKKYPDGESFKGIAERFGFVPEWEIDPIQMIVAREQQEDVLEKTDDDVIGRYLFNRWTTKHIFETFLTPKEIVMGIPSGWMEKVCKELYDNHRLTYNKPVIEELKN